MPIPSINFDKSSLEALLKKYIDDFAVRNRAAKIVLRGLSLVGVGARPVLDHLVFRALDPSQRALEFLALGYEKSTLHTLLHKQNSFVDVYCRKDYPAVFILHANDPRMISWIEKFGDGALYYLAIRVGDIEEAVFSLEKQSIAFLRPVAGSKGEDLRQIASLPETQAGQIATTLVLVERHVADTKFYAPDFWMTP